MSFRDPFVYKLDVNVFAGIFPNESIDLLCFDPPYMGIVDDEWDNQWATTEQYVDWFMTFMGKFRIKMARNSSVLFFGGIGQENNRAFFDVIRAMDRSRDWTYRNIITWKKRRAYGKEHDYLFCREEIAWYSTSSIKENVTFNIPLLDEKRGYAGFNAKYPAKSEYKRVSNVWDDIPELMRPERKCQKPLDLMDRIIKTHSNPGDVVVDPFVGWGSTGVSAVQLGRDFIGGDMASDWNEAERRIQMSCSDRKAFR